MIGKGEEGTLKNYRGESEIKVPFISSPKKGKHRRAEMSSFDQPLPPYNASDPTATFVGTSCLDFLLIELVPMAYRIANELEEASDDSRNNEEGGSVCASAGTISTTSRATSAPSIARKSKLDEDEEREAVFFRLEGLGYRVGLGLVERYGLQSFLAPFLIFMF